MYVVVASDCRNLVFLYDLYYPSLYSQWLHYDMDSIGSTSRVFWVIAVITLIEIHILTHMNYFIFYRCDHGCTSELQKIELNLDQS